MIFLLQNNNKIIEHDFIFHLIQSCEYNNWYHNTDTFMYRFNDDIKETELDLYNLIPIGNVEFVHTYLYKKFKLIPKPLNIPSCLNNFDFTKRFIYSNTLEYIIKNNIKNVFIKSNDIVKGYSSILDKSLSDNDKKNIPDGNYQISDLINIESEWRCFVYKNELVGIRSYIDSDDFKLYPDIDLIQYMIFEFKSSAPIAYTLDVGINKNIGTFLIECHNFYSCGLYGFNDYTILPFMFSTWYYEYLIKNNINTGVYECK